MGERRSHFGWPEPPGDGAPGGAQGYLRGHVCYTKHPDPVPMAQPAKTQKVLGNGFPTVGFG